MKNQHFNSGGYDHPSPETSIGHRGNFAGQRPDWMPDPGVYAYVCDFLESDKMRAMGIDIEVARLDPSWIPVTIVATMDWVMLCGWWLWDNTGVLDTSEAYQWIFDYDGYEFDPDQLMVFREDPDGNAYSERWHRPGIHHRERSEVIQFVIQDHFRGQWKLSNPPPQEVVEYIVWATFLWILSDNGKEWMATKDDIFGCVYDYGIAYLSKWDQELLDPQLMVQTKRPVGTCRSCGEGLHCVTGFFVKPEWHYYCHSCAVNLRESGHEMDERDERLHNPLCGAQDCMNTRCPHLGITHEDVIDQMQERGTQRINEWREEVRQMGGVSHRQLAGQTVDDIIDHFRQ